MAAAAKSNVTRNSENIELVQSDVASYVFPLSADGILSTFALALVPEFDAAIRNAAMALLPGRRFVLLDFKRPSGWFMSKAALARQVANGSIRRHYRDGLSKAMAVIGEPSRSHPVHKSLSRRRLLRSSAKAPSADSASLTMTTGREASGAPEPDPSKCEQN